MKEKQDGRQLSKATQEKIRRTAVQRVLDGESPESVIRELGLHRSRIYAWLKDYKQQGETGLLAKPISGRPCTLDTDAQWQLMMLMLNKSPRHLGLDASLWSSEQVAALITKTYRITLGSTGLKFVLERLGFGKRRLKGKLAQRHCAGVDAWLAQQYPRIQRQATQEQAALYLCSAFWQTSPAGKRTETYTLQVNSSRGELHFMVYSTLVNAKQVIHFLQQLLPTINKKLFLLIDNDPPLRKIFESKPLLSFFESHSEQLTVFHLPSTILPAIRSRKKTDYPRLTDSDQWVRLLNQSLLDFEHPLSSFLSALNAVFEGVSIISPDLHTLPAPIRANDYGKETNLAATIAFNERLLNLWPSNPFLQAFSRPGDLYTLDEIIPRESWESNDYCQELLRPPSVKHGVGLCFAGLDTNLSGLFIYRRNDQPFDVQNRQFLRWLRPHLEIAYNLAVTHWRHLYTLKALEETADHQEIAALVLDGKRRVITYNGSARAMLAQKHYLKQVDQQLVFLHPDWQTKFDAAVNRSIAWRRAPIGNKPIEAIRFTDKGTIGVLVQPMTPPSLAVPHSVVVSPHVIVYITDPAKLRPDPQQQFIAQLFHLSAREAHLSTLLISGRTVSEAAKAMNITQATARTYLQHIYEKVGVKRQHELVQRVMKSVALLA